MGGTEGQRRKRKKTTPGVWTARASCWRTKGRDGRRGKKATKGKEKRKGRRGGPCAQQSARTELRSIRHGRRRAAVATTFVAIAANTVVNTRWGTLRFQGTCKSEHRRLHGLYVCAAEGLEPERLRKSKEHDTMQEAAAAPAARSASQNAKRCRGACFKTLKRPARSSSSSRLRF